jgi:hypothetical protein
MAVQRQGPPVLVCTRCPGPRVIMSPARVSVPPQIGEGPLRFVSETRIMSWGTATKAIRGRYSSAAERRMRCRATWVSRARNAPGPVASRPRIPSSSKAAPNSSASLNTEVTLPGISSHQVARRVGDGVTSFPLVECCGYSFLAKLHLRVCRRHARRRLSSPAQGPTPFKPPTNAFRRVARRLRGGAGHYAPAAV